MNNNDYYRILGISSNSTEDDIKMAYKKLAMRYHPDRNPNNPHAEEKFKEIKNAYEKLTNKNIKERDDINGFDVNFSSSDDVNFADFIDTEASLNDVFKIIFNKELRKGSDTKIISTINVDLEQAIYGSIISLKVNYQGSCEICLGKGFKLGANSRICSKCGGSGFYTTIQGIFTFKQKCYKCNSRGYSFATVCSNCKGSGKLDKMFICLVNVFKRSDNNSLAPVHFFEKIENFSFKNSYVLIKIKPHPIFIRRESRSNDLYCKFIVDFAKSILGGYIKIYTLYGYIKHKIRKGSQCNEIYRIKDRGLNFINKSKKVGDLYLEILIEIPLNITYYQKSLIKRFKLSIINDFYSYPLIINWKKMISSFCNSVLGY